MMVVQLSRRHFDISPHLLKFNEIRKAAEENLSHVTAFLSEGLARFTFQPWPNPHDARERISRSHHKFQTTNNEAAGGLVNL